MKLFSLTEWALIGILLVLPFADVGGCAILSPSGPRLLYVVREASQVTPELAALSIALRDGPAADYLKSKSHNLLILDNDDSAVAKFAPWDNSKPELLIVAPPDKLLSREPLPPTANAVLSSLKSHGG